MNKYEKFLGQTTFEGDPNVILIFKGLTTAFRRKSLHTSIISRSVSVITSSDVKESLSLSDIAWPLKYFSLLCLSEKNGMAISIKSHL